MMRKLIALIAVASTSILAQSIPAGSIRGGTVGQVMVTGTTPCLYSNSPCGTWTAAPPTANLLGGALGSVPYQSAPNTTVFVASPTTTGTYLYGWGPTGSTIAPTAINLTTLFTSPTFTGTPLSPTATAGANTTQIASTAFVHAAILNPITNASTDIGAQINTAITAAGSSCVTMRIPYANYNMSTEIIKPACIILDFQGSTVQSSITATASIAAGGTAAGYSWGGIRNLTLFGPGTASTGDGIGIWLGGDSTGVNAPSSYLDFSESFVNVTVIGFSAGWERGIAYQDSFYSISAVSNYNGWVDAGQYYGENMNFYGAQIVNNTGYGFYSANMDGTEYDLYGSSCDYNISCFYTLNGSVRYSGGHIEQSSGYTFDGPASSSLSNNILLTGGVTLALTATTGSTEPGLIHVTGYNSNVKIDKGLIVGYAHAASYLINWTGTGFSSLLDVGPYEDSFHNPGLSAVAAGTVSGWVSYPLYYNNYTPSSQYFSGMTVGNPALYDYIYASGYGTDTACASAASPAVCGSAPAGFVAISAGLTSVFVDTTAFGANSVVVLQEDETLGTALGVTCNSTLATVTQTPVIINRSAGVRFQFEVPTAPATNPLCFSYHILN